MAVPASEAIGDALSPIQRRFVMHWGEMGTRWGVNRTVAQVHALLFLSTVPLHAERIAEVLQSPPNVSTSLKELQGLKLVRTVHMLGDRRDHFETGHDVWELMRTAVRERKAREFDPTIGVLADCLADPAMAQEEREVRKRIEDTHGLMLAMSNWGEQMLRLEPATLMKVMKLGAKIQKLLQDAKK